VSTLFFRFGHRLAQAAADLRTAGRGPIPWWVPGAKHLTPRGVKFISGEVKFTWGQESTWGQVHLGSIKKGDVFSLGVKRSFFVHLGSTWGQG
jgi:hypothetical protein